MANIHCRACGTIYRYEKEGCCPNCGAYNRPPKRERVNADGTVQHMTDEAYEKRQKDHGKVCFEKKECYEEKVCYEDQTRRRSHGSAPKQSGPVPHSKFPATESAPAQQIAPRKKTSTVGCFMTFFLIVILMIAVVTVASEVFSSLGGLLGGW